MKININIGGKTLTATLADNATARDFAVSMKDLFGREKYSDLPKALSENGPSKNTYDVGNIAYWAPDQQWGLAKGAGIFYVKWVALSIVNYRSF